MWDSGGFLTRNISEAPADVVVSSWSQVLDTPPPLDILSDAAPVEAIPSTMPALQQPRRDGSWVGYTLQAPNNGSRCTLGTEFFVAEEDGWDQMVERGRMSHDHGLRLGLDEWSFAEKFSAGNAVDPRVARWIAEKLIKVT